MRKDVLRMVVLVGVLVATAALPAGAQDGGGEPDNSFLLTGFGFSTYTSGDDGDGSFSLGFNPILLYRVTDSILFEAELEFDLQDEGVETEIGYAQIDWLAADGVTVVFGKFLTPFGQFIERRHPAWINKLPSAPLMYKHGTSLVPFGQVGFQVRGGIGFGESKRVMYSAMVSNGFALAGHDEGGGGHKTTDSLKDEDGEGDHDEGFEPLFLDTSVSGNGDLAYGGRVSVIPIKGLEVGASYLTGTYDEFGTLESTSTGLDLSYHHDLFDLQAEWVDNEIDRGFADDGDSLGSQQGDGWFIQPSLRLAVIPAYFLNRVEAVVRVGQLKIDHEKLDQLALGFNYYFTGSSIVRVAWEQIDQKGGLSDDLVTVMFALGF